MLPAQLRLRNPQDFARLRQQGQVVKHKWMLLSYLPNKLPHNRYGVITSKAIGNAVTRNRTKRQLRAIIRQLHPHLSPGYDIVIVTRRSVVGKPFHDISRSVDSLAHQANLIL
ncbi:MAG: ribonuclease P protein component, partial [Chloroflexota bacterium]